MTAELRRLCADLARQFRTSGASRAPPGRRAKVLSIKQELLDLAAVREEAADNIEDRMPGRLTLAMRKVLAGPSGVRDRWAYNIAVEREHEIHHAAETREA